MEGSKPAVSAAESHHVHESSSHTAAPAIHMQLLPRLETHGGVACKAASAKDSSWTQCQPWCKPHQAVDHCGHVGLHSNCSHTSQLEATGTQDEGRHVLYSSAATRLPAPSPL